VTEVFAALGGEIDAALERIRVPAAVVDRGGRVRYLNERARTCFGDANGRLFTDLLSPESRQGARLSFTRTLFGAQPVIDEKRWLRTPDGDVLVEIQGVAIEAGERVVGVFGIVSPERERRARPTSLARNPLTPRQLEVLEYLADGRSTAQIAAALGIARDTVRNHVRGILRALGVHSRLEAVVEAHRLGLVSD
jgi:PAS domain S-box-containing protein